MRVTETISTAPIPTQRTVRPDAAMVLTSGKAGKCLPIWAAPLLREDSASGTLNLRVEMAETVYPLANAVYVTAQAHFVPFSAFERFHGLDDYNRAYAGEPNPATGTVTPLFETNTFKASQEIYRSLGMVYPENHVINWSYVEAYNAIYNYRAKARHPDLPVRAKTATSLARAFWHNPKMRNMVSDYEQAMMDGVVPLQIIDPAVRLKGIIQQSDPAGIGVGPYFDAYNGNAVTPAIPRPLFMDANGDFPRIFAELENAGITVSLANIELAKQTAAFAKLAEQFSGRDDVAMDLLLQGIRVPDEYLRDPILLSKKTTFFGYRELKATDGASLGDSVTTGVAEIALPIYTPPMNTGGIIMVTVEIVPEQLWERQADPFLGCRLPGDLPNFREDFLDPEKVDLVKNFRIDALHATPGALFAYEPLNEKWRREFTRLGGKFRRTSTSGWFEARGRFWSPEVINPQFDEDFILCPDLPHTVFADAAADPFEILLRGGLRIAGNTVFGKRLTENEGHFDMVQEGVDLTTAHDKAEDL